MLGVERFRSATARDIDLILQMMRRYYEEDDYPFSESRAREAVSNLIGDENLGRLWVVLEGVQVIGYVAVTLGFSLEYQGRDAFVDELFIAEEYRGKGLGRDAMGVAEEFCRELGVNALHLEVERHRGRAHKLYQKIGFKDHDRYLMTKWLTA